MSSHTFLPRNFGTHSCLLNGSTCLERSQVHWHHSIQATSSRLTSTQPKFPKRTFFRHPRLRQNLLLSDLTLDYQLSTPIITIQHWWEILEDVFFHEWGFESFYFWIVIVIGDMIWYEIRITNIYQYTYLVLEHKVFEGHLNSKTSTAPSLLYADDKSQNKSVNYIPNQIQMWEIRYRYIKN